jgi:hypothetical protein
MGLSFDRSRLIDHLQHPGTMLELTARVQIGVIRRARLPHLPKDFQPALTRRTFLATAAVWLASTARRRGLLLRFLRSQNLPGCGQKNQPEHL